MKRALWFFLGFLFLSIFLLCALLLYPSSAERFSTAPPSFQFRLGDPDEPNHAPRLLSSFLSPEEVRLLIQESDRVGFNASKIEDHKENTSIRQSETCWLYPADSPTLRSIYERVLTIPELQAADDKDYVLEPCQIVRYGPGGHYREHYDQCYDQKPYCIQQMKDFRGPRKWTLIMYLTDDFEGGETYFNNLNRHVRARAGDALLFHGLTLDNTRVHPSSLHQGMPLTRGEKRIANIWIHYTGVRIE